MSEIRTETGERRMTRAELETRAKQALLNVEGQLNAAAMLLQNLYPGDSALTAITTELMELRNRAERLRVRAIRELDRWGGE